MGSRFESRMSNAWNVQGAATVTTRARRELTEPACAKARGEAIGQGKRLVAPSPRSQLLEAVQASGAARGDRYLPLWIVATAYD